MDRLLSAASYGDMEVFREVIKEIGVGELSSFLMGRNELAGGNLIHRAVKANSYVFLCEALTILPSDVILEYMCQAETSTGSTPLHYAANDGNIFMVKLLVNAYVAASIALGNHQRIHPWLMKDFEEETPLSYCFIEKPKKTHEYVAMHLVSRDHYLLKSLEKQGYPTSMDQSSTAVLDNTGASILYCAMRQGFSLLAERILTSGHPYSLSSTDGDNPLHHASKSNEEVSRLLLEKHPELIGKKNGNGYTVLDIAVENNAAWLVQLMLLEKNGTSGNCAQPWNKACRRLIWHDTNSCYDTPLHITARKGYIDIAKLLVLGYESAIRDEADDGWDVSDAQTATNNFFYCPMNIVNSNHRMPVFEAIQNKHDDLGVYLLSVTVFEVGYLREVEGYTCSMAEQNGCTKSRRLLLEILVRIHLENLLYWGPQLSEELHPSVLKIFHHFTSGNAAVSDVLKYESIRRLANEGIHRFSTFSHKDAKTHLKDAAELGEDWLVKLLLEGDSTLVYDSTPAWQIACQKGNLSTVLAFVEQCDEEDFIKLCQSSKQTPLHHIQSLNYEEYRKLLTYPLMQKLKNQLDDNGATPLHRAVDRYDIDLTQALLETEGIQLDIEDMEHRTVFGMFEERCRFDNCHRFWFEGYKELLANPYFLPKLKNHIHGSGFTPLHIAIEWADLKLAKTLVHTEGIDLRIRNRDEKMGLDLIEERCDQKDSLCYELYRELFDNPNYVHELKNRQVGINNDTPLHRAIKWNDINLAKKLLETNGIELDKEDKDGYTVLDLLEERYSSTKWGEMCREIRLDPSLKVFRFKYLQRRTSLKDMNNTLSVVAALLATITFAAGFAVPGGVDSKDGTATLGKKPAFIVFAIANTGAMCSSMVVLFMVIGAMIWEAHPRATRLIDLCVSLLQLSLCGTIVAFMSGVYAIMAPMVKSVAIIVIILCSSAFVVAFVVVIFFWPLLYKPFKMMKLGVCRLVSHMRCGNFCGTEASSDDYPPFVPQSLSLQRQQLP